MKSENYTMVKNSILLSLLLLITGACSPKVVGIYNTSINDKNLRTFIVEMPMAKDGETKENELLNKRLHDIITTELENKGLTKSSLPDIYVNYMISVYNTSETTSNDFNRFNDPYYRSNYYYPSSYDYTTREYKTGVFIIDIKNAQGKLIWQGSKTFKLKSRESVRAAMPEICQEVIAAYDVNH